jgi:hypothetical protein
MKVQTFILCAALLSSISFAKDRNQGDKGGNKLDVMFYNVENLFDAEHDEGKEDWTFLPEGFPGKDNYCKTVQNPGFRDECEKSDWTERSIDIKLNQIKTAVFVHRSALPNMMGLAEIENDIVVGQLSRTLGFRDFVVTNSPDNRGIDVALMYNESNNLRFVGKHEHVVKSEGFKNTRNILEVEFELGNGEHLFVYVNHWPSPNSPAAFRVEAAHTLQGAIDRRLQQYGKALILAMGDFNTLDTDSPHPFETVLLSHKSRNPLFDLRKEFDSSNEVSEEKKRSLPLGTQFFAKDKNWNNLDRFFVNRNLLDKQGVDADVNSFDINAYGPLVKEFVDKFDKNASRGKDGKKIMVPYRYNIFAKSEAEAGYSDHYAISMSLSGF